MQALDRTEIKRLLAEVPNQRHRLMLVVTFNHGLRVSETIGLTGSSIRDGFVTVQRLKGSMKTIQPYMSSADPDLDEVSGLIELSQAVGLNERLFPMTRSGVYRLMQRCGERAGLPKHKLHPHGLKHAVALATIHTAGIENVRQWLGHKSISSTGSYLRVTDDAAAKAVAKAMSFA
jgi:site-specific recombinase XerD